MKIRRFFLSILALCTVLSLCCAPLAYAGDMSLQDIAIELINGMHDLANDTTYLKQWTLDPSDDEKSYIRSIAEADCSRIDTILSVDDPVSTTLAKLLVLSDMCEAGREISVQSLYQWELR